MTEFKIFKIIINYMAKTDQKIAIVELAEVKNTQINISEKLFTNITTFENTQNYIFDFNSHLAQKIIRIANEGSNIELDMTEFRCEIGMQNGEHQLFNYHKNVINVNPSKKIQNYEIDYTLFCNKCQIDLMFCTTCSVDEGAYFGINEFEKLLSNIEVECMFCGQNGKAGNINLFILTSTNGLDKDLIQTITTFDKREWFFNLDFIFQYYLKQIFNVNESEEYTFALYAYNCIIFLKKEFEMHENENLLGVYKIETVKMVNGENKNVIGNLIFLVEAKDFINLPNTITINPKKYSAKEKPINVDNKIIYKPLLKKINVT